MACSNSGASLTRLERDAALPVRGLPPIPGVARRPLQAGVDRGVDLPQLQTGGFLHRLDEPRQPLQLQIAKAVAEIVKIRLAQRIKVRRALDGLWCSLVSLGEALAAMPSESTSGFAPRIGKLSA
jgi:hypothetical protein